MSIEVVIPVIGQNIKKAKITDWLKKVGDTVEAGEPLLLVEAEKVSMEVESPGKGILARILVPEKEEAPVGSVVAIVAESGEEIGDDSCDNKNSNSFDNDVVAEKAKGESIASGEKGERHIVIIGGGSGGYVAAIRAAQLGAQVTLVEKKALGGTCLHTGCMPTKAYLAKASVLEKLKKSSVFKNRENVTVDMEELAAVKDTAIVELEYGISTLLSDNGITVIKGTAVLQENVKVSIEPDEGQRFEVDADNVIIATGARPVILPGVEVDGQAIHTTDTIWNLRSIPKKILIVGTGAVGVEFACIFNALGSAVTLIEAMPEIMPFLDSEISKSLGESLENRGIEIMTATKILSAQKEEKKVKAVISGEKGDFVADVDMILMAIGRVPVTRGLNLESCGVKLEKGAIAVNSRMETDAPGIYAVGDVVGGVMLAHAAFMEADVAVENIMGGYREAHYPKVPNCIYSFPEVGAIGMTEEDARIKYDDVSVGRFPIYANGKARVSGETEGMVKILSDMSTGEILGAHILCEHATELIGEFALGITAEATVEEVANTLKAHPTLSESLAEAAMALSGLAIHLPPKN